jgi:polyisoprenyl-phosphate glycosyltransferase
MSGVTGLVSVVIPVYRTAPFVADLTTRIATCMAELGVDHEIIFVDDASPDDAWAAIAACACADSRIKALRLARNFGQHYAITAGVARSRGQWVVVMDGDLQDRPEEIARLLQQAHAGYDVVFARRQMRHDGWFRRATSALFYRLFDLLAGGRSDPAVANFGVYSRRVIDHYNRLGEHYRLFPAFIRWLGFPTAHVDVEHGERPTGRSAYTLRRRLDLAFDAIIAMSNKPLKFSVKAGFTLACLAFLYGVFIIIKRLVWGVPILGWSSLIVSLYFIGGLLLLTLGVLGIYIGRIFDEVKNRPLFIVCDTLNLDDGGES